jgi:hypothetical protein
MMSDLEPITFKSLDYGETKALLKEEGWMMFRRLPNDQYFNYLEHTYFPPNTIKNREFEIIMAIIHGLPPRLFAVARVKDTPENRLTVYASFVEFYKSNLKWRDFGAWIQENSKQILAEAERLF